jgi:predicted membrane protein
VKRGNVIWVGVALAVLLYGSVLVFEAFDRNSNSASDTVRPFTITMGPVWALAIAAATVLLRKRG